MPEVRFGGGPTLRNKRGEVAQVGLFLSHEFHKNFSE